MFDFESRETEVKRTKASTKGSWYNKGGQVDGEGFWQPGYRHGGASDCTERCSTKGSPARKQRE